MKVSFQKKNIFPISLPLTNDFATGEGWGFVSNIGDSRAVLFHQGRIIPLSNDHKVNRCGGTNAEMERVISLVSWLGNFVVFFFLIFD